MLNVRPICTHLQKYLTLLHQLLGRFRHVKGQRNQQLHRRHRVNLLVHDKVAREQYRGGGPGTRHNLEKDVPCRFLPVGRTEINLLVQLLQRFQIHRAHQANDFRHRLIVRLLQLVVHRLEIVGHRVQQAGGALNKLLLRLGTPATGRLQIGTVEQDRT
uniref:Uncharacterized protein n=1 Tax=Anopheles christyi TaxID=43041 RepID=A0A182KI69_9DIPT